MPIVIVLASATVMAYPQLCQERLSKYSFFQARALDRAIALYMAMAMDMVMAMAKAPSLLKIG